MYVHFFFFFFGVSPRRHLGSVGGVRGHKSQLVKIEFYVYYSEKFYSRQKKRTKTRGGIRREVKVAVNVTWEKTPAFLIGKRRMKFVRNRESVGVQEKKKTKSLLDSFGGVAT